MKLRVLLLGGLLACSGGETPTPADPPPVGPEEPGIPAEPQPEETPQASLLARAAAARGFPVEPPLSGIGQGFLMRGKVFFHRGGGAEAGGETVEQDAELWLGGPARMRMALSGFGRTNLFLLQDREHSWVRVPGSEFRENPPEVLAEECLLRDAVMRFPWGWEDQLAAAEESAALELERTTPAGPLRLVLDEELRPHEASVGAARVLVADWREVAGTRSRYPHAWDWPRGDDRREEWIAQITDQAFFLDGFFAPPPDDQEAELRTAADLQFPGEELQDLVRLEGRLAFLSEEDASTFEEGEAPGGAWWRHGGHRYYLPTAQSLLQPEGADGGELPYRATVKSSWLRWTTTLDLEDAQVRERLASIAHQLGMITAGRLWALVTTRPDAPRVYLLPVQAAPED